MRYQKEPERAWQELIEMTGRIEAASSEMEAAIAAQSPGAGIAITEGHLSLSPHNANPILYEWLSAVYHAKSLNIYQRHGAHVKIATAADFNGTRWTNLAVMLETPRGSQLSDAGGVDRAPLQESTTGTQGVDVKTAPSSLDVAASRTAGKVYLHVANLEYKQSVEATFAVAGMNISGGRVLRDRSGRSAAVREPGSAGHIQASRGRASAGTGAEVALSGRFGIGGRVGRSAGVADRLPAGPPPHQTMDSPLRNVVHPGANRGQTRYHRTCYSMKNGSANGNFSHVAR